MTSGARASGRSMRLLLTSAGIKNTSIHEPRIELLPLPLDLRTHKA
jgi:hypothetical protein